MKNIIFSTLAIISILTFNSCDKVDQPFKTVDVEPGGRKIIIEEFTGHTCTACPAAAIELQRLVDVYGDQIIPVAIHAGDQSFNEPRVLPDGSPATYINGVAAYTTDFRTADGNTYASKFGITGNGLPKGIISRQNGGVGTTPSQWESEILAIKDIPQIADIEITTVYDSTSRVVTADIAINWLTNTVSGNNYRLQVYLIEDHITDWQLNAGVDIPDYDHRHVFRGAINATWGEAINATAQATTTSKSYSYSLDTEWNQDNCEIVAFIYKESPDYEVMQANIEHVK
jgi:thiol-disulfide isomerase/thioredoxin